MQEDVQTHIEKVRADASQKYSNFGGGSNNNEELINSVRECFAELLTKQKQQIVDLLNKNGFPTSYKVNDNQVTMLSLKAMQVSNDFRDGLTNLMKGTSKASTKKNFASQSMGLIPSLNMTSAWQPAMPNSPLKTAVQNNGKGFVNTTFFDNCKNCNKMEHFNNADGSKRNLFGMDLSGTGDWLKIGIDTWSADQQRQADSLQAQLANEIEAKKIAQIQAQIKLLEAQKAKADSGGGTVVKVVAIGGILTIVGIATYFIFKKKKIN